MAEDNRQQTESYTLGYERDARELMQSRSLDSFQSGCRRYE